MARFTDKVYEKLRKVPKGRITTYKILADSLHSKAYRAVGTAMNKNPYAPEVPCHRVINSDGSLGQFATGTENKIRLLRQEGVKIVDGKVVDFKKLLFRP